MKLYYAQGACSLAVRITLYEIGVPCEFESVNLKTKQTETGQNFLDISPKGGVPALLLDNLDNLDNQVVLTENIAIQQYLAEKHQATHPHLLPALQDFQRYRVLEWLSFIASDLHKSCAPFFNPQVSEEMKENLFKPLLKQKLHYVSQQLNSAGTRYLSGNHFTIADSYLFVVLSWLPALQLKLTDWPTLANYFNSLRNRPAIQRAITEEGISLPVF